MADFKITLEAARVNRKLTQEEVANAMGVSKYTILSWEKGNTFPKVDQFRSLCSLYDVPMDFIFVPEKSN